MYASSDPTYHAIAGAVSGCLTRFICQPLDVVKIRFQLQVEPIKKGTTSKYQSMLQTFRLISKEESIYALWKGHVPAQLLSIIFGTSQFYTYTIVNQYLETYSLLKEKEKTVHFISGATAGCCATMITFPLDIIRTRLIAQSSQNIAYMGTLHSCKTIYKTESFKGFFRGLLPSLLQIAPHVGLQFETYEIIKDFKFLPHNEDVHHHKQVGIVNSLVAGCIAGLVAKTIVYPLDLARKRLQIQGFEHGRKGFGGFFYCTGLKNCLSLTIQKEGISGLFKGLGPSQFKAALTTAFHFTFYEQALNVIQNVAGTK
ncbi:mitochondrial thiamine pyrophosphate carrier-like [Copidosoma floridanum]|uniref:mitochondrial thiamine pyrophosphate carrier n=1 Tax=Copidosoma floridanum TaxID=29053 RepID=UPI0006C9A854|nr:mitochondrial thiamine pyrophosphate carrier [Copidosoma floridanum]XP_014214385.1 mitochondrial thiamine pyrophosphate carrier [Copidosoma floridanum]XP_023247819.1 mitochondrial thiamine pyrophosphate carrier-like [Copidosoma floridanum]XP_023247820.1 mitochondrial thiamine pyrophosphate carrier-like [Copidosoma floridanum]